MNVKYLQETVLVCSASILLLLLLLRLLTYVKYIHHHCRLSPKANYCFCGSGHLFRHQGISAQCDMYVRRSTYNLAMA